MARTSTLDPRPSSRRRRAVEPARRSTRPARPVRPRRPRPVAAQAPEPTPVQGIELRRLRGHLCWTACGLALFLCTRVWLALGLAGSEETGRLLGRGGSLALTLGLVVLGVGVVGELLRDLRRLRAEDDAQ